MTRTYVLMDDATTGQNFSQVLRQCCLTGATCTSRRRKKVDICVPEDYGECAPYANDNYPLLGHRSVRILSEGGGIESVGKRPEDPHRRKLGIGRTYLGQNHRSSKHEQTELIPSRTFVSLDLFLGPYPPLIRLTDLISYKVGTQCPI